ncbi:MULTISPECIES: NAD-dependent epimerase/dehydratase family protein [unclassified Streptomyces]|uniref:NAD-dependent epimerase/dehydratase family protein n=1 Tax=unclassified Streptomyces TaxID=2593676 RepID=UPI0038180C06
MDEVIPVEGDFSEPETWRGHLDGTDVVVHLLMDMSDPVGGDRRLFAELLAAQERDGRRRLVFTTGISSYGRTGLPLMDENTPGNPESPIGFRFVLEKELAASGLAHTVIRPGFMNGGPATTSMTGQWFAAAEAGDMMQMAADQDELVSSAKAHRLLGWTPPPHLLHRRPHPSLPRLEGRPARRLTPRRVRVTYSAPRIPAPAGPSVGSGRRRPATARCTGAAP